METNVANDRPDTGEVTGAQGLSGALTGTFTELPGLNPVEPGTYATYRKMRADPTIALARMVVMAPILASSWSFEAQDGVPDDRIRFIRDQLDSSRSHLFNACLRALDYGWAGFEKVFEMRGGRLALKKIKPLLPDVTRIQVNRETGAFEGFKQTDGTLVPLAKSFLYTYDQEGDNYYGRPRMENCRRQWDWWEQGNEVAARYDRKVAGVMPVVHYPLHPQYITVNGVKKHVREVAQDLLNSVAGGKGIAVPNELAGAGDDRDGRAPERRKWLFELLEDRGSRQPGFVERLRYLDSLKFRGYLRPERVALEGQFGTKAESGEQGDLALTDGELLQKEIDRFINWHVVDQLLALNFGDESRGTVYVESAALQDSKLALFTQVVQKWADTPDGREDLRIWLDFDAILDLVGMPKSAEVIAQAPPEDSQVPGAETTGDLADRVRRIMEEANGDPIRASLNLSASNQPRDNRGRFASHGGLGRSPGGTLRRRDRIEGTQAEAEAEVARAERQVASARAQLDAAVARKSARDARVSELNQRLDSADSRIAALKAKQAAARSRMADLQAELAASKRRSSQLSQSTSASAELLAESRQILNDARVLTNELDTILDAIAEINE